MFINFITGYYEKSVLVLDCKKISLNYLKTWFIIDFISSIPFSLLYLLNARLNFSLKTA